MNDEGKRITGHWLFEPFPWQNKGCHGHKILISPASALAEKIMQKFSPVFFGIFERGERDLAPMHAYALRHYLFSALRAAQEAETLNPQVV